MSLLWDNEDLPGGPPAGAPRLLGQNRTASSALNPLFGWSGFRGSDSPHGPGNQTSRPHTKGRGLLKDSEPGWGPVSEGGGLESQRGRGPPATRVPGASGAAWEGGRSPGSV